VLFRGEIHAIKLKGNEIVLQTLVDMFLGYMDLIDDYCNYFEISPYDVVSGPAL
jgi:hypothetical protein